MPKRVDTNFWERERERRKAMMSAAEVVGSTGQL